MRRVFLLLLLANVAHGQSVDDPKYSVDYMLEILQHGKNRITLTSSEGTKIAIREIARNYKGAPQQQELIYFYKAVYDYKIVDKTILDHLADSLINAGLTNEIKVQAGLAKEFVKYRILGTKMRDFAFPDKHGKPILLSSLKNKFVVVELWAGWCSPCIKDMTLIPDIRISNSDVEFYSICVDKKPADMTKFVDKKKYDWPLVFGGQYNEDLFDYLHIVAIPKYYTIDRSGIVINVADHLDKEYLLSLK
jgi:thiol-disulfide isomerase/thioredoxin